MERTNVIQRAAPRENQHAPQNHNQNIRRNPPQIKHREQRGPDQQIIPPFQENYVDDDGEIVEEVEDNEINLMGINDDETICVTQEEQELFQLSQTELD